MAATRGRRVALWAGGLVVAVLMATGCASQASNPAEHWLHVLRTGDDGQQEAAAERLVLIRSQRAIPILIERLEGFSLPTWEVFGSRPFPKKCGRCNQFDDWVSGRRDEVNPQWGGVWPGHALARMAPDCVPEMLAAYCSAREAVLSARDRGDLPDEPLVRRVYWLQETMVNLGIESLPYAPRILDLLGPEKSIRYVKGLGAGAAGAVPLLMERIEARNGDIRGWLVCLAVVGKEAAGAAVTLKNVHRESRDNEVKCFAAQAVYRVTGEVIAPHITEDLFIFPSAEDWNRVSEDESRS